MQGFIQNRFRLVVAFLVYGLVVAVLAAVIYQNTLSVTLASSYNAGVVRLGETASRLRLQIDGFRALANVIADDPQMAAALATGEYEATGEVLGRFEATYGAWRIDLTSPDGEVLASSTPDGDALRYPKALLRAAGNNRLGYDQALEGTQRIIRLSRGVSSDGPRPIGAVIVNVSLDALEFEWPVLPEPIVFFDPADRAFSSNRPDLLFRTRGPGQDDETLDFVATGSVGDRQIWRFTPPNGAAQEVILAARFVPHLNMTGLIILDTTYARSTAQVRAILVLGGGLVLGLIGLVALQQRRGRLVEEQYSAELEARVEARTEELRGTQDALVEASKLAALGRLSAGVSHELNQPLAAILNFAENGQKLLARDRPEPAAQNLTLISDQVHRITRIIGNLRAFARQEVAPTDRIDFREVVQTTIDLARDDIDAAEVVLQTDLPDRPFPVLAGRVRLEQVLLNLITNALDAMADRAEKTLTLSLQAEGPDAVLTVSDTGHGIADPSSVFEPFYTTKDLGASKGLGMGLALSFGIITRFGGTLSCRNLDHGAEFKVTLPLLETHDA